MRISIGYVMAALFYVQASIAMASEPGMNSIGEAFVKAFRASDVEGVAALYAPEAVSYPPDMMIAKGQDEIRVSWGGLLNHFNVKELTISDAHHVTQGDISCAWGQFKMILIPKEGGDPVQMEGRFSDFAKLINGKWLYLMDHASVPLPPPPEEKKAE